MPTRQGDLALLDDPVAQRLLQSTIPARLAYTWTDGTPRVVPIGFHWNGEEIVLGTFPDAPKMTALRDGAKVALTIDSDAMPYKVLQVRGAIRIDTVEGIAPEYAAMTNAGLRRGSGAGLAGQPGPHLPADGARLRQAGVGRHPGLRDPLPERHRARDGASAGARLVRRAGVVSFRAQRGTSAPAKRCPPRAEIPPDVGMTRLAHGALVRG